MTDTLIVNGSDSFVTSVGTAASFDNDSSQGANAALIFTAVQKGVQGNDITIAYIDDVSNPSPPTVEVDGLDIIVNVDSGVTIASAVETALEGDAAAAALITVANKAANNGTGVVTAFAEAAFTGGTADVLLPGQQKVIDVTTAELAAFVAAGCAATLATSDYQARRALARTLKYNKVTREHGS